MMQHYWAEHLLGAESSQWWSDIGLVLPNVELAELFAFTLTTPYPGYLGLPRKFSKSTTRQKPRLPPEAARKRTKTSLCS